MNMVGFFKYAGALVALAVCSACAGSSAVAPSNAGPNVRHIGTALLASGTPVTAARLAPMPRYTTIVSDRRRRHKKFEYIINDYGSYASIFDYPKSKQQVGTINNVGGQGCTNVLYGYGKGIIWIVAGSNQIEEFKVPGTPIKTLSLPNTFPTSCAMDTSGDLAVGIYTGTGRVAGGNIVIFKNGSSSGTVYTTPLDEEFFDGYDPKGNLFADGFTGYRSGFALVELPKGSSTFKTIATSNAVQFPGSVQWDGTYLTVFDQISSATYRYTVSGTKANLKSTVTYTGPSDCAQTWIVKGLLYCGDAGNNEGEVFQYPAGGSAIAILTGNFDTPLGVTAAKR
jgi:hypothetical protein